MNDELNTDQCEALGLDPTGRDGNPHYPYRHSDPWIQNNHHYPRPTTGWWPHTTPQPPSNPTTTTPTLPHHPDGTINTTAEFGPGPLLVEITWNTDPDGNWTNDNTNRTLHGPFTTFDEATTWSHAYPEDTDIQDITILHTNAVRPT